MRRIIEKFYSGLSEITEKYSDALTTLITLQFLETNINTYLDIV